MTDAQFWLLIFWVIVAPDLMDKPRIVFAIIALAMAGFYAFGVI